MAYEQKEQDQTRRTTTANDNRPLNEAAVDELDDEDELASSATSRALRRSRKLRLQTCLQDLAPPWRPWKMTSEERQAWFRVGGESWDSVCANSSDWCLVGRKFENRKLYEEAAQAYSRSIRLNPHCPGYYFRLGCVQCELREWNGACESFNYAINLAPPLMRATYYFNLGYAHSELRSWQEAIEVLKKAIELRPRKHVYHNLIAVCYRHSNEYELSIYHYKHAIALDRIQYAYRRNLAYVYMQLKQWGRAVRAWSGAIEVAHVDHHPELFRNRAFAQAERGYLAVACEDMQIAHDMYTSLQQRKRCREKLDRWTSRLQGTEQAYLRNQQQVLMERHEGGEISKQKKDHQIRQLAGLIQGEWEEWHGEDCDSDDSNEDEDDMFERQTKRARLDIAKRTRRAPGSTRFIKHPPRSRATGHLNYLAKILPPGQQQYSNMNDEERFHATSSSAYIQNLIDQLDLNTPWEEKEKGLIAAEKRVEREARQVERAKKQEERRRRKEEKLRRALVEDAQNSGHDTQRTTHAASSHEHIQTSSSSSSSESDMEDEDEDDDSISSHPPNPSYALSTPSPQTQLAAADSTPQRSMSTTSLSSETTSIGPSPSMPDLHPPDQSDLYVDDSRDPYSSLSKLFIRLRIDSKYLWRFEDAGIHLNNIHLVKEEDMKRVLPPLGPRLTLMNYLQDRITRLRGGKESKSDDHHGHHSMTHSPRPESSLSSTSSSYPTLEMSRGHREWQTSLIKQPTEYDPQKETEREVVQLVAAIQTRPKSLKVTTGSLTSPSTSPLASPSSSKDGHHDGPTISIHSSPHDSAIEIRTPINPRPIVPASPHNSVIVKRPLSSRDRRHIYDAHTNPHSVQIPVRTIGSVNWK